MPGESCPRCGRIKESADVRFCGKCGLDFVEYAKRQVTEVDEGVPCTNHPKELTLLRCGRCDKPICTKCVILGPAGPRCKECAKTDKVFRPGAVGLGAKRTATGLFNNGFKWYWWVIIGSFLIGGVRSCMTAFEQQTQSQHVNSSQDEDR